MNTILSVDPGSSGGIAILHDHEVRVHKMPDTPHDLGEIIENVHILCPAFTIKAYVEQVGGYVSGPGQPGSAMFAFGENFGIIQGILIGRCIPYELVIPHKWQKALGLPPKGTTRGDYTGLSPEQTALEKKRVSKENADRKRDHKNRMKEMAQRLFPHLKVTLCTSDALLLLEYARRTEMMEAVKPPQPELIPCP